MGKGKGIGWADDWFDGMDMLTHGICCCCLAVFCLAGFVFGCIFIFETPPRDIRVEEYNKAVDDWVSKGYGEYEGVSPTMALEGLGNAKFKVGRSREDLKDDHDDLKKYDKFIEYSTVVSLADWPNTSKLIDGGSVIASNPAPSVRTHTKRGVRYVLTKWCVIVRPNGAAIAKTNKDDLMGCFPADDTDSGVRAETSKDGVSYFVYQKATDQASPFHNNSVDALVYSQADPYLTALKVTEGSLEFGSTKATLVGLGIGAIVLGCLCLAPGLFFTLYRWRETFPILTNLFPCDCWSTDLEAPPPRPQPPSSTKAPMRRGSGGSNSYQSALIEEEWVDEGGSDSSD